MVLLPALILTYLLDQGQILLGSVAQFDGTYFERNLGLQSNIDHGILTLACNFMFLQTIMCPIYGTNGPLWSLANEFWYYTIFPFFYYLSKSSFNLNTIFTFLVLVIIACLLPNEMLRLGILWIAGYGAFLFIKSPLQDVVQSRSFFFTALVTLLFTLFLSRLHLITNEEYWIGGAFAAVLPYLAMETKNDMRSINIASYFGNISFTLYLIHFPFLGFIVFGLLKGQLWQPDLVGIAVFCAVAFFTLAMAHTVWWMCERRTDEIRRAIRVKLHERVG